MRQPSWIDYDADGDLDLFIAFRDRANALFENNGGRFDDIAPPIGLADARKSVGAVWFDFDQDGDLDLYVANQDGDANGLFRHDDAGGAIASPMSPRRPEPSGPGARRAKATNGTVRPCAFDADGDGGWTCSGANYGPVGLLLLPALGHATTPRRRSASPTEGRFDTCAPADVDHDGRMDFYVNGTITGGVAYRDFLLRNTGERFADATADNVRALPASHGASWADVDGDGDLDLALAGTTNERMPLLLRNQLAPAAAARSLRSGSSTPRSSDARRRCSARLQRGRSKRLLATRLVDSGSGYNSQSDLPVHVGLCRRARRRRPGHRARPRRPHGHLAAWDSVRHARNRRPHPLRPPHCDRMDHAHAAPRPPARWSSGITGSAAKPPAPAAKPAAETVTVYRSRTCGCCGKWVQHMRDNGFEVVEHIVEE